MPDLMHGLDFRAAVRAAQSVDPGGVIDVIASAARDIGATDVTAYLVDFEQRVLEPLPDRAAHADLPGTEVVTGTMAGRAFTTRSPVVAKRENGTRVWVPILEASDRTGVLALSLPAVDDEVLADCAALGVLAGYLIAAHSRSTDVYQLHRRRRSMSLAASMQWDLLPPVLLSGNQCSVAARLEPAYTVGGDSFDYALNPPMLDIGIIDAMGHGTASATIAALAIGSYRHDRREGRTLLAMHASLNEVLDRQFAGEAFATGQLAQLELDSGTLSWINAGHPCPLLVRDGRVVKELEGRPSLPWGLGDGAATVYTESLQPGDGVLLYTDGVVEARAANGEPFGLGRLADIIGQCASDLLPAEEVVRSIVDVVLQHQEANLRDDATVVLVEWNG